MSEILTPAEVAEIEARCTEALASYEGMPYPTNGMWPIVATKVPALIATLRDAWVERDYWQKGSSQHYQMYQDSQTAVKQLLDDAVPFLDQNREHAYKDALRTIRQLREVLEFYGWMSGIYADRGERARKALGRGEANEQGR